MLGYKENKEGAVRKNNEVGWAGSSINLGRMGNKVRMSLGSHREEANENTPIREHSRLREEQVQKPLEKTWQWYQEALGNSLRKSKGGAGLQQELEDKC